MSTSGRTTKPVTRALVIAAPLADLQALLDRPELVMLDADVEAVVQVPADPQLLCVLSRTAAGSHQVAVLRTAYDIGNSRWTTSERSDGRSITLTTRRHRRGSQLAAEMSLDEPPNGRRAVAQLHINAERILHRISGIVTGALTLPPPPPPTPLAVMPPPPLSSDPVVETLWVADSPARAWAVLVSARRRPDEGYLAQFQVRGTPSHLGRWICGVYPAGDRLYGNLSTVTVYEPESHLRVVSLERHNLCQRDWSVESANGGTHVTLQVRRRRPHADEQGLAHRTLDQYRLLLQEAAV